MKYWHVVIALLYGAILAVLMLPLTAIAFYPEAREWIEAFYGTWIYWVWLLIMIVAQAVFLIVPVKIGKQRPVSRRLILLPVISCALMFALLVLGVCISITEAIVKDVVSDFIWWIFLGVFLVFWGLWGIVFFKLSRKVDPKNFIEKACSYLFKGSILELLVVVPTHILARYRNYCCAGVSTFMGIVFGVSVMLFAFGPGVVFLYVQRYREKKRYGKNVIGDHQA
jgi:hypothetical protein